MIRNTFTLSSLLIVAVIIVLGGCAGGKTFNNYARQGDTVAVATGWNHEFQRDNVEVTITDNDSPPTVTTYTAPNDAIRGSVNFYPDPVSGMVMSERLNADISTSGKTYSDLVNSQSTGGDRDWWQTVLFIDLPSEMATGPATITIRDLTNGALGAAIETAESMVEIVAGTGAPNVFNATLGVAEFDMQGSHFEALERVDHFVVEFSGATIPEAIQVDLTHDPDESTGGTGTPYVINPTGTVKGLSWASTGVSGTDLRVIMTPTNDGEISDIKDFKFYVAGGVVNVAVNGAVQAFDANGSPVAGIIANVTPVN